MVQRKTCVVIESFNFQPETRFGQEHLKNLGPEMMMMMMKRTKPRRKLKDNSVSSQSGKSQATPKHDLVVKVTGGSPNYMKGTSSSEARKENKKRFNLSRNQKNQTGSKHDSRYGVNKERSNNKPSLRIGRGLTKAPSFKRCSQRATCSSTLKDSKFPEYLMLNHGETYDEVNGTSVLKVCPYTYCSLNGHLHSEQYPPLKSFISLKRQSLKSKKSVKMEASKEEFVKMDLEEKKEFEHGNGNGNGGACEVDIDSQISETVSKGAPRSETDSDDYSDSAEMVRFSEGDHDIESKESGLEETLVDDYVNEVQEKANRDGDADLLKESDLEETLVEDSMNEIQDKGNRDGDADQSGCSDSEVNSIIKNSEADNAIEETLVDDSVKDLEKTANIDGDANQFGCFSSEVIDMTKTSEADNAIEETLVDDSVKEIQEKENKDEDADQSICFISEVIDMTKNSAAGNAIEDKDDAGEETFKDKAEDCKEESQDQTEVILMTEENAKVPFNRTRKPCNQEEPDSTISWTITKCKKPVAETEDLRAFYPREPNYLPIVVEEDAEKVDLKHQDIDERRNSEDWMFDYALQRAVSKLAPARKRKVALLVEAFETVQPIMPHGREPAPVLSCERHLQACN